jgi:CRISPR/Cas system CSM-associated protein Csm3 (group 7 of RAMP superfamily)
MMPPLKSDQARARSRVARRLWARGEWMATSGVHLGGDDDLASGVDMTVLRDSLGEFLIPGSSIAGALRSAMAGLYATTYGQFRGNRETAAIQVLFGKDYSRRLEDDTVKGRVTRDGYASLLTVYDARAAASTVRIVRDSVRIEPETGLASDGAKFNLEVLPAGVVFPIELTLTLYEEFPAGVTEADLTEVFQQGLSAFHSGLIRLGAKTRRGLGEGRVANWKLYRLDMENVQHVAAWLKQEPSLGEPVPWEPRRARFATADSFEIEAQLRLKTSLLIRSSSDRPGEPDMVHLTEQGRSLITGSSLAGAFRHRCRRIARTIQTPQLSSDHLERLLASLFGPVHNADGRGPALFGGRLWVSECHLTDGSRLRQGRVAIDRFTGGALESALFEQSAFWPADANFHVTIHLRIEEPRAWEIGLCLQTFKDLWLGDLPLGGEAGVGRGVFLGYRAQLVSRTSAGIQAWVLQTPNGAEPDNATVIEGNPHSLNVLVGDLGSTMAAHKFEGWEKEQWAKI